MKLYSRSARNFLAFFADSLLRRLQKKNGNAPPSALKTRSLNLEHLENREYLSADGLVLGAIEIDVAPLDSLFVEVAQQTSVDAQPDLAYAFNVSQIDETEETFCESLDSLVFDESLAEFDAFQDDALEIDFAFNGVDYVNLEKLDIRSLVFDADLDLDADSEVGGAGLRSGGGGDPIPYDVSLSSTITSVVADMSSVTVINPVLEQRVLGAGGVSGNPLNGADYLEVHLPALPYGYYGVITIVGNQADYSIYVPVGTVSLNADNSFAFSGGSTSSFFLLPKNNATPQAIRSVVAVLDGVYPESSGGSTQEYDFYGNAAETMTIIDDDQWLITATTPNSIALETNPDTPEQCVDGVFNLVRVANSTAQGYAALSVGYYLDATYPITVMLNGSGTASHGADYLFTINGISTISATIAANATSQQVNVTPWQDRLFETDETVVLNPYFDNSAFTVYDTAPSQSPVVIYQAPEFLSGNDSGTVNADSYDMGFIYGKPSLGDSLGYALQVAANRGYRFELVVDEDHDYFELNASNNIVWKDFPTTEEYNFSITVKVVDSQHATLYDTIVINVVYGWANFVVMVDTPDPNDLSKPATFNFDWDNVLDYFNGTHSPFTVGHAFWRIEATSSLYDYYQNYPSAAPSDKYLIYFERFVGNNFGFGWDHNNDFQTNQLIGGQILNKTWNGYLGNGSLRDDNNTTYDYYQVYSIPTEASFQNVLNYMHDAFYESFDFDPTITVQLHHPYNLFNWNCVNTLLRVAQQAGITSISVTPQNNPLNNLPGLNLSPIYTTGSLVVALSNPIRGAYTLNTSLLY